MLANNRSVHGGGVGLLANGLLVSVAGLVAVLCGVVLGDVLLDVAADVGSDVLVVGVVLLVVEDGLDLLVDLGLLALAVHDGGDLVVGMLRDVLVNDRVEDVAGVGSANLVIDNVLCRLAKGESSRASPDEMQIHRKVSRMIYRKVWRNST